MRDLDKDGTKDEVIVSASGQTDQGAAFTITSLNPEIVKIKKAVCSNSAACYGKADGANVYMYQFTGTLGTAKIAVSAPATTGYIALNDTIVVEFGKKIDQLGKNFKSMTVEKGSVTADFFIAETPMSKLPVTYTFDGQATSTYLINANGALTAGNEDATVKIRATVPEAEQWAAIDSTITITIGAGNGTPIMLQKPQAAFKAKFMNDGIMLSTPNAGLATVEIFSALGHMEQSTKVFLGAGSNMIPVSGLSAGKYIIRVKQGSNIQKYLLEKK